MTPGKLLGRQSRRNSDMSRASPRFLARLIQRIEARHAV